MNNRKVLTCIAAVLLLISISCIAACVMISAPSGEESSAAADSSSILFSSSEDETSVYSYDEPSEEQSTVSEETSEASVDEPVSSLLALPPGTVVNSPIAVVYNAESGDVLYAQNENTLTAPASLTKLLTAIVALEYLDLDQVITVGEEIGMIGEHSSIAFLAVGQRYKVSSLLDALLLPSGNDAAYVLAVNAARAAEGNEAMTKEDAVEKFLSLMNAKAAALGCENSHFCSPDGYDAEGQVVTGFDMVKIAAEAIKHKAITDTCIKETSGSWVNNNILIRKESSYYNEHVTGLKTGSTDAAGYCVAASAVVDEVPYILVFLGSADRYDRFKDTNTFIDILSGQPVDNVSDISAAA